MKHLVAQLGARRSSPGRQHRLQHLDRVWEWSRVEIDAAIAGLGSDYRSFESLAASPKQSAGRRRSPSPARSSPCGRWPDAPANASDAAVATSPPWTTDDARGSSERSPLTCTDPQRCHLWCLLLSQEAAIIRRPDMKFLHTCPESRRICIGHASCIYFSRGMWI